MFVSNTMYKALIAFSFLFVALDSLAIGGVIGDPLTKSPLPKMPLSYRKPSGVEEGLRAKREPKGVWVVYSDRDDNYTYLGKNCDSTQRFRSLSFMDPLLVVQETEDAVRVVPFDNSNEPYVMKGKQFYCREDVDDWGWIKKRNLLLWKNALVDDTTQYTIKAISVKRLKVNDDISAILRKRIMDLYKYPKATSAYENKERDITLFQYFFVLKIDKSSGMYLLSTKNNVAISSVQEDVLGWATNRNIHVWDNGICLRINFDEGAVQERKEKNIKVSFFAEASQAKSFRDGKPAAPLPFNYTDPSTPTTAEKGLNTNKDNPYLYGFPIIERVPGEKNIFKTGYITNTIDNKGNNIFSSRKTAELKKKFRELAEKNNHVKIVFVLDGAYRNKAFKALSNCIKNLPYINSGDENRFSRKNYDISAVIYNDTRCDQPIESIRWHSGANKEDFADLLFTKSNTPPCVMDRDRIGAPLFYDAIKSACDLFDDPMEANMIIVVGGASTLDKTNRQAAVNALIEKQVRMAFVQLQAKNGENYAAYVKDCRLFLQESATSFDKKYFSDRIEEDQKKKARVVDGGNNNAFLTNSAVAGSFSWKDPGMEFSPNDLKKIVQGQITENDNNITAMLSKYEQGTTGTDRQIDEDNESMNKQLMVYLRRLGINDNDAERLATKQNYQIFIEGYASLINKNLNENLLEYTLFMSKTEYNELAEKFRKLEDFTSISTETREEMINHYKDIINAYKGGNMKLDEADGWTLDKMYSLITTLPETGNPLFKKTLKEMKDPKKTPDAMISQIKSQFSQINMRLTKIRKNEMYKMSGDDDDFYWVPEKTFQFSN